MILPLNIFLEKIKILGEKIDLNSIILQVFYTIPVILVIWLIFNFGVNVPLNDDWTLVDLFGEIGKRTVKLEDFWIQHNEHRMFFPKIIFVIFAFLSKWNLKLEMYFSVCLSILTFIGIYKIANINQNKNRELGHIFNIITCILFFSLLQYHNWLWGFQIAWFLINFCLVLSVFILVSHVNSNLKFSLAAFFCFIASFSSAHGILTWLVLIPSLGCIENQRNYRQNPKRLFLWIILFLLTCFFYSLGYHSSGSSPNILLFFEEPLNAIRFFLIILGGSLESHRAINGCILLLIFLFFHIYLIAKKSLGLTYDYAPWISIGWFTILFALITTLGRYSLGINAALASRYVTVSVLLAISCVQMLRLLVSSNWSNEVKNTNLLFDKVFIIGFLSGIFIVSAIATSNKMIKTVARNSAHLNTSQACLEVIHFLDTSFEKPFDRRLERKEGQREHCLQYIYHPSFPPSTLRKRVDILENLGFRRFPKDIAFINNPDRVYGEIKLPLTNQGFINLSDDDRLDISGFASLPKSQYLPELVLLSYGDRQSFFLNGVIKPDKNSDRVKWTANIKKKFLPAGEMTIEAWVYDRENKQFVKLNGQFKVKV